MPAKTNTEQIQEISKAIQEHIPLTNYQLAEIRREHQTRTEKVNEALQRIAVLEQRAAHVEKQVADADHRRWQVSVAFITSLFAAIVALVVALLKK